MKINQKYINIDWLSCTGEITENCLNKVLQYFKKIGLEITDEEFQTKHTRRKVTIKQKDIIYSEILYQVNEGSILAKQKPNYYQHKIHNQLLYGQKEIWQNQIDRVKSFSMDWKVQRIDISIDFQKLGKCSGNGLINGLITNRYLLNGFGRTVKLFGKKSDTGKIIKQSITFGSGRTTEKMTLYNKTAELKVSNKKYIEEAHAKIFENDKDVWRLELSITPSKNHAWVNPKSGEMMQLATDYISGKEENLAESLAAYVIERFDIRKNNKEKTKVQLGYKTNEVAGYRIMNFYATNDIKRAKMHINRCLQVYEEYQEADHTHTKDAAKLLILYAKEKKLEEYLHKKIEFTAINPYSSLEPKKQNYGYELQ